MGYSVPSGTECSRYYIAVTHIESLKGFTCMEALMGRRISIRKFSIILALMAYTVIRVILREFFSEFRLVKKMTENM